MLERDVFLNNHCLNAAFIYEDTLLVVTTLFRAALVSLLITGMLVRFAKPIPGGLVATVPLRSNPFTAFIET